MSIDRIFRLKDHGTDVATEVRAGMVTFLTMSYILFVNPQILSQAGMPAQDVAVATALAAAFASLAMAALANFPLALAPGMGLNAYFTFSVVGSLGVSWQVALAAVFVEGLLFVILTLAGIRAGIMKAIPASIKVAMTAGIGLFLAIIGLQNAGLVIDHPVTLMTLGDVTDGGVLLALGGLMLMTALMASKIRGAILIGILAITVGGWLIGLSAPPETFFALPQMPQETFLALDFEGLMEGKMILVVLAFLFVDFFDTAGTLIGVGRMAGLVDEKGNLPKANRAFAADALGTIAGALFGTSTVTSYVESATGVREGGKTGLTAATTAAMFLLALFVTPFLASVPAVATAPALILVGALMMGAVRELQWSEVDEALPAFLTVAIMPFSYSIANGISLGIVSYVVIKALRGRFRDIHPVMAVVTLLLIAFYAVRPEG